MYRHSYITLTRGVLEVLKIQEKQLSKCLTGDSSKKLSRCLQSRCLQSAGDGSYINSRIPVYSQTSLIHTHTCLYAKGKNKGKNKGHTAYDEEALEGVVDLEEFKGGLEKINDKLKEEFLQQLALKTNASNYEQLKITTEDGTFPLNQLATVIQKSPTLIVVNLSQSVGYLPDVMNALTKSGMNINPQQEGTSTIFIPISKVTKEHREDLAKGAKKIFNTTKDRLNKFYSSHIQKVNKNKDLPTEQKKAVEQVIGHKSDDDKVLVFGSDIRKEFMLREHSVFLNHGSYGTKPRCVHERQMKYLEELESHPDVWFRYNNFKYLRAARATVADFMGVHTDDIYLLQNVTKGLNTVIKTCPVQSGDSILISTLTHGNADVTVHTRAEQVTGVTVQRLNIKFPIRSEDSIVEMYEDFLQKHPNVKLTIVDHISSPTSVLLPVKRITEVCHRHDVIVVIDAAHAPGQIDVDIQDIDADFYIGNLYKWVFCPRSCAFIWTNPYRQHTWFKPLISTKHSNASLYDAFSYEGTKDDIPYLCASDGIDYFRRLGGHERITKYNTSLLKQGVAYLEEKWGVKRLDIPENMEAPFLRVLHLPFIPGYTDNKVHEPLPYDQMLRGKRNLLLQKHLVDMFDVQVAIVTIEDNMMIRVTSQVYNTMEDFIKLGDAVLQLMKRK